MKCNRVQNLGRKDVNNISAPFFTVMENEFSILATASQGKIHFGSLFSILLFIRNKDSLIIYQHFLSVTQQFDANIHVVSCEIPIIYIKHKEQEQLTFYV